MLKRMLRCIALAAAFTPILVACGGGNASDPSPITPAQCSGATCTNEGPPASQPAATALCPADADIAKNTYLGGSGSGEVVSLRIDPAAMSYSLTFLDSPIPLNASSLQTTRAGLTITGAVQHPAAGSLPSPAQIACAFQLQQGTGTLNGTTYTTAYNASNPPTIYVGFGVAGGGIPGATVSFSQDTLASLLFPNAQARSFDFYPFIGFSSVSTNLAVLKGSYNALSYHILPSNNFAPVAEVTQEQYDAGGNCSVPAGATNASCATATSPWTVDVNGGYFDSANAPQLETPTPVAGGVLGAIPNLVLQRNGATAHLILGQLNNTIVPIVVRTGYVNETLTDAHVDDESGIALMAPATTLALGSIDGSYIGADSNFDYTASLISGQTGGFLNPSTMTTETQFALDYTQTQPGLLGLTDASGNKGNVIAVGGLYGVFVNGEENGGVTPSSANSVTPNQPYFGVGALIKPQ